MSKMFIASLLTTFRTKNNTRVSREALTDIEQNHPPVSIVKSFMDPEEIGRTLEFKVKDDGKALYCRFEIDDDNLVLDNFFLVPQGLVGMDNILYENGVTVITKMELVNLTFSEFPADIYVTKIEETTNE